MATITPQSTGSASTKRQIPFLENGDCLDAAEFLRRWDAMPELKQAELINGVVFMNAALRYEYHGDQLMKIGYWLNSYAVETPGVRCGGDCTVHFADGNILQPDVVLFIDPHRGGRCQIDEWGYLHGSPELIVEVAASSSSRDLHQKKEIYERAGVKEYLIWDVFENEIQWLINREGTLTPLAMDQHQSFQSEAFPGLWLNPSALLAGKLKEVRATVEVGTATPEHARFVQSLEPKSQPE